MKKLRKISFQNVTENSRRLSITELMSILGGTTGRDCTFQCLAYAEQRNGLMPGQPGYKSAEDFENEYLGMYPEEKKGYEAKGADGPKVANLINKYFTTVSYTEHSNEPRPLSQILDSINSSNIDVMLKIKSGSGGLQHCVMATGYHTEDPNDPKSLVYEYYDPQNKTTGTVKLSDADPLFGLDNLKRK